MAKILVTRPNQKPIRQYNKSAVDAELQAANSVPALRAILVQMNATLAALAEEHQRLKDKLGID